MHNIYAKFIPGYNEKWVYFLGKIFSFQFHPSFVTIGYFIHILNSGQHVLLAFLSGTVLGAMREADLHTQIPSTTRSNLVGAVDM